MGRPDSLAEALFEVAAWLDYGDALDRTFIGVERGDSIQRDLRTLAEFFKNHLHLDRMVYVAAWGPQ